MTITQLEKLKQIAASDKTPESIRKELIDILSDRESVIGGTYYQPPVPVRTGIEWQSNPWSGIVTPVTTCDNGRNTTVTAGTDNHWFTKVCYGTSSGVVNK